MAFERVSDYINVSINELSCYSWQGFGKNVEIDEHSQLFVIFLKVNFFITFQSLSCVIGGLCLVCAVSLTRSTDELIDFSKEYQVSVGKPTRLISLDEATSLISSK